MNKCECGCGLDCKNKFVHGHNGRGVPRSAEEIAKFKSTLALPEVKKKQCEGTRKSWTDQKKRYYSEINTGKKLSDDHKNKIGSGNSGKIRTDKVKLTIANSLKGRFIGELNPFFKHGLSNKNKTARQTFEYKQWRKTVFERDNYTCQSCGISGGVYITAHHIKSFAHYPELRYDISNGQTLCEECHSKTDNYKGKNKKSFTNN